MSSNNLTLAATGSSHRAVYCARLLKERVGDTASVSVRTLFHDDGSFHAEAFHTVHRKPDDPNADGPFMREAVTYSSYPDKPEHYEHVVQHFFEGVRDRWYEYTLETVDADEVDA